MPTILVDRDDFYRLVGDDYRPVKLEDDHAGLFALKTADAWRGRGLGRAIVAALLAEARRRGAATAYLQVTANNGPALALYRRFGFGTAYEYWYRAREGERH